MADINVLDLTEVTPVSNDDLIVFDRDTGEAKSTRYETFKNAVTSSVDTLVAQHTTQIQALTNKDTAIESEVSDIVNVLGSKNLLPNNATSQVVNGVTFTVNDDGSITASGTANANIYFLIASAATLTLTNNQRYTLSGCPSSGGQNTYYLYFVDYNTSEYKLDTGTGIEFTYATSSNYCVYICIASGQTVPNLTFYPMIRPASIADDTYVPYAMTNRELTKSKVGEWKQYSVGNTISSGSGYTDIDIHSDCNEILVDAGMRNNDQPYLGLTVVFPGVKSLKIDSPKVIPLYTNPSTGSPQFLGLIIVSMMKAGGASKLRVTNSTTVEILFDVYVR